MFFLDGEVAGMMFTGMFILAGLPGLILLAKSFLTPATVEERGVVVSGPVYKGLLAHRDSDYNRLN